MELVSPAAEYLDGYVHALKQAQEQLVRIAEDPATFLSEQIDREISETRGGKSF